MWVRLTCGCFVVKVPKPTPIANGEGEEQEQEQQGQKNGEEPQLPVTLVRIPAQSLDPRHRRLEADGSS